MLNHGGILKYKSSTMSQYHTKQFQEGFSLFLKTPYPETQFKNCIKISISQEWFQESNITQVLGS